MARRSMGMSRFECWGEDVMTLTEALSGEFEYQGLFREALPMFRHRRTGMEFQYIPSGSFVMGLGEDEERHALAISDPLPFDASEMRPARGVDVKNILVARRPMTKAEVRASLGKPPGPDHTADPFPAYLSRKQAERALKGMGCRFPKEHEWEYFCRSGHQDLFAFGNSIPADEELERWMHLDLLHKDRMEHNDFGLQCLFNPEWCEEKYRFGYSADEEPVGDSYVVRGGGAYFWPWQDEEWIWCVSAMRFSSEELMDGEACLRPVYDLSGLPLEDV